MEEITPVTNDAVMSLVLGAKTELANGNLPDIENDKSKDQSIELIQDLYEKVSQNKFEFVNASRVPMRSPKGDELFIVRIRKPNG